MDCQHPLSSQYVDRVRGQTSCMLCGQVLSDQHFELDPAFARGERGGGGGMRAPGFARPSRAQTAHGSHGLHRPSIDAARRQLTAIARKLSIPPSLVDIATAVFKMAVTANSVVGARSAVLCAALYIVCRRHQSETPLTVMDFSDVTGDSPFAIVSYMKIICKSTNTPIPPVDPVFYVARLCQVLNIAADVLEPVAIYAMKVMRAMTDDWIATGRRPLGVAAASVIVACQVHHVDVNLMELAETVRLHHFTIVTRVEEFAATPTAALSNIDEYESTQAGNHTAPAAFLKGRRREGDYVLADEMRSLSEAFYELLNGAKAALPPTPERIELWNRFIIARSATTGIPVDQLPHDLTKLSPHEQLEALGALPKHLKKETTDPAPLDPTQAATQARELIAGNAALRELDNLPETAPQGVPTQGVQQAPTQPAGMQGHKSKADAGATVFEVLDLGTADETDAEEEYVIYDNEVRLRAHKAAAAAYNEQWDRAGAKYQALLQRAQLLAEQQAQQGEAAVPHTAAERRTTQRTKVEARSALESVQKSLRSRGGGHIDLGRLADLLPNGGFDDEDLPLDLGDDEPAPPARAGRGSAKGGHMSAASEVSLGDADEWVIE